MRILEQVPFVSLTTFKVGGDARYVVVCESIDDIQTALTFARERSLPWYVIGDGSNILASDEGYTGVLIKITLTEIVFTTSDSKVECLADAGVAWDMLVEESVARGLWGLENLAGIPGSVGASPVQNIGAYGADVSDSLLYVEALDTKLGTIRRFSKEECLFGYRDSLFKKDPSYIIIRVAFILSKDGSPHIHYADLAARIEKGEVLDTPQAITKAVREIRAKKFPDLRIAGTAGSFFKNPTITREKFEALQKTFPELPGFPITSQNETTTKSVDEVKIPLAWILDHVLHLRGYTSGHVRLFEQQPLVLVAEEGATAQDIDALAQEIEEKVFDSTGITIEREVRMLNS